MNGTLKTWTSQYRNTADTNDHVFEKFTTLTDTIDFLKEHKDFVEANDWGMGFRAFPYLWLLILADCNRRFGVFSAMEIGVFKGQTISLWGLIARQRGFEIDISAISPFSGNQPNQRCVRSFKKRFSRQYKARKEAGQDGPLGQAVAFHDLRHMFCSFCLMSGIDPMSVAKWLGHRDNGQLVLETYGHLCDSHLQRAAQQVQFGSTVIDGGNVIRAVG